MGRAWCNSSVLHFAALLSSLESISAGELVKKPSPSSLVSRASILCPHRCTINHPCFVSGSPPLPCVQAVCLPNSTSSRVLSQMGCVSKPTLILWGRVSLSNGWVLTGPRKCSRDCAVAKAQSLHKQKYTASTRVCCPQPASLFLYQ